MEGYFSENGLLAEHLPAFESRAGQLQMAQTVQKLLEKKPRYDEIGTPVANMLVAEAETGIGKTLAYLVPSILSERKVVVSTATINLQDQIIKKEIPLLEEILKADLKALCVKGRQNYLCHYKWYQYRSGPQQSLLDDQEGELVEKWLNTTETGDKAELEWLSDKSPFWNKIAAHSNSCLGGDCPEHAYCFVNQLRRKAAKAQLLIVNHHLLFSDLSLRKGGHGEVLPRYEAVIFDEAHHVENVATSFFGKSISQYQILDLLGDLERQAKEDLPDDLLDKMVAEITGVKRRAERFTQIFPTKRGRYPLHDVIEEIGELWQEELTNLSTALIRIADRAENNKPYSEIWSHLATRAFDLDRILHEVTLPKEGFASEHAYVHWYERKERSVVMSATPIHVADELEQSLYHMVDCIVFTSATLSTSGTFSYFKERLGLPDETEFIQLPSPFDYEKRTLLYVPDERFPEPSDSSFLERLGERVVDLIKISKGRALILFTSFRGMDAVAEYLESRVDYPVYIQGTLPRRVLLERFAEETDSVLLAVASFWEGVDVPGESLSCVIIDKLPFEVPSDPVFKARVDEITQAGGKPFFDFQIPRAILSLKQGVGRLMRSSQDGGVIAILDVRLFSKGYGRNFRKSLPSSPIARSLQPVEQHFEKISDST